MSATTAAPSNWNVANGLTALRIALVPLFAALLLHDQGRDTGWRVAAAVAFGAAVLTDRIDGELARNWGMVTDLGKIADPIADKALIGAALISLSVMGRLWWVVTALILVRELGITLLRFMVIRHGVMPAGRGGKAKTAAQALAIMLYIIPLPAPGLTVAGVIMAIALALTLVTGAEYVVQAGRLREGSERTRLKRAARRAAVRSVLPKGQPTAPAAVTDGDSQTGTATQTASPPRSAQTTPLTPLAPASPLTRATPLAPVTPLTPGAPKTPLSATSPLTPPPTPASGTSGPGPGR